MKIEHAVVGRTNPTQQGLSYLSPAAGRPSAFGAGIGSAVRELGLNVQATMAELKRRDDATKNFAGLQGLSTFKTDVAMQFAELKRGTEPGTGNFIEQAEAIYLAEEQEFLATIPPDMQDEFRARTGEIKSNLIADAFTFHYEVTDAFYKQGIADEFNKSSLTLDADPSLDTQTAQIEKLEELIDASDLPPLVKAQQKRDVRAGLQAIAYKAGVRQGLIEIGSIGVGRGAMAEELLMDVEGFREGTYADTRTSTGRFDAWRLGFGSDTITTADGRVLPVKKGDRVTREDAMRDLRRRIAEEEAQAVKAVGQGPWERLPENAQAALISVAYNYGSLPGSVRQAIAGGDVEEIAAAVGALKANPQRRAREAALIRGEGGAAVGLEADERFADVAYEDRVALRADAEREASAELQARASAAQAAREADFNRLMVGINDGLAGQHEIDQWREPYGLDVDYDKLKKAQDALAARDKEVNLIADAMAKYASGETWSPTSDEDRDFANALFGVKGPAALQNMDQSYVDMALVPFVRHTKDIPTEAVGLLTGMMRNDNPQKALFALDVLSQLNAASEHAYMSRVPEQVRADVRFWNDRKNEYGGEDLLDLVRGGDTVERRQLNTQLREEATRFIRSEAQEFDRLDFQAVWNDTVPDIWLQGGRAQATGIPPEAAQFSQDFQTFFTDEYVRRGNVDKAREAAIKRLQETWGEFGTDEGRLYMRNPPNKMGYPALNNRYDWIDDEVRREQGLAPEDTFRLIADQQTLNEHAKWQEGQAAGGAAVQPPSYIVSKLDADGVFRELPERQWFQPPEVLMEIDALRVRRETVQTQLNELAIEPTRLLSPQSLAEYEAEKKALEDRLAAFEAEERELLGASREEDLEAARERFRAARSPLP